MKSIILIITLLLLIACQPKEASSETIKQPAKDTVNETVKEEKSEDEVVLMPCTKEAKQCDNGKMVGRNPKNNCEFDPCEDKPVKKIKPVMCPTDVKECADGSFVSRDHYNNCRFKDCPNSDK